MEAINYWQKQLDALNENNDLDMKAALVRPPDGLSEDAMLDNICMQGYGKTFNDVAFEFYENVIPSETTSVEGQQTDVDDFDEWQVNYADAIDFDKYADQFAIRFIDYIDDLKFDGSKTVGKLRDDVEILAYSTGEDLVDDVNCNIEHYGVCTHKGSYNRSYYY